MFGNNGESKELLRRRTVVLITHGLMAAGLAWNIWGGAHLITRVIASILIAILILFAVIVELRKLHAEESALARQDARESARDKMQAARHREVIAKFESNDLPAVIEQLRSELEPRRLTDAQKNAIREVALTRTYEIFKDDPPEADDIKVCIGVVSLGTIPETIDYRNDVAQAFNGVGVLVIQREVWQLGNPELDDFRNTLTVTTTRPDNRLWPEVIEALRVAIPTVVSGSSDFYPPHQGRTTYPPSVAPRWTVQGPNIWIIVGHR